MHRVPGRMAILLVLGSLAIAACKEPDPHPPAEVDPGRNQPGEHAIGGGGGTNMALSDASTDGATGSTVDGGTGGACTSLPLTGSIVDELSVPGTAPVGSGGLLVDGTYDLTAVQKYVGAGTAGATGATYKSTILISEGTKFQRLFQVGTVTDALGNSGVITGTSPTVTFTPQCPAGSAAETYTYTQTQTSLILTRSETQQSYTYTLKP